ncbi:MAG TPA: ribosome silencing factor, partial [Firmicutes bacterium]|nr:ribosome silencing factor [Bacillota bacterium]
RAIAQAIEERLEREGVRPSRKDGLSAGRWVLLDYGGVVVHVFHEEERDYYNLERYWQAAERLNLTASSS